MKWPDFLEKKEKLFSSKTSREEAQALGDRYLEADRLHDAVAFYRRASHGQGLARLREMAVGSGDFQLFEETLEDIQEDTTEQLRSLAHRAEELGRLSDARRAYGRLGDEVGQKRATEALARLMGKNQHQGSGGQAPGEGL